MTRRACRRWASTTRPDATVHGILFLGDITLSVKDAICDVPRS